MKQVIRERINKIWQKREKKNAFYQRQITRGVNGHIKHISCVWISQKFQWKFQWNYVLELERNITEISVELNFTEISVEFNFTEISVEFHWNFIDHWSFTGISLKFQWNKWFHWNSLLFHWNFNDFFSRDNKLNLFLTRLAISHIKHNIVSLTENNILHSWDI